ncbi:hypothetical protein [Erythrobacter sp. WG]|uniref:hypothetical protein n=1 Tax=Erythrobacter sp. WG TaxID=2985510 RepID=UPI00227120F6|nr:hypothetical protein [Erythrobacter sp. WG]MCX9147355.1 hypothetical protein [Erythrobacter sp. WG]
MPMRLDRACAVLEGHCTVEEAHDLAEWLVTGRAREANLAACAGLHAAVLQCLMALAPQIVARPADPALGLWLDAALPAPVPLPPEAPPQKAARAPRRRRKAAAAT